MKKFLLTIIAVIFLLPSFAHADIKTGLQLLLKFDSGSEPFTIDSSGNGHTATNVNNPSYVSGKVGPYAISPNETGSKYVDVPFFSALNSSTFTVGGWFNSNDVSSNTWLIHQWDNSVGVEGIALFAIADQVFFEVGGANISTGHVLTALTWYHIIAVNNSGTLSIYVNGVLSAGPTSETIVAAPTNHLRVSNDASDGGVGPFTGKADDIRFYNRALSSSDITELYNYQSLYNPSTINLTPPLVSNGLVGWWTMDGKDTPGRAIDRSASNNPGYFSGIATSTFYAAGKIGQAVKLDGVNDYANVGDPANGSLDFGTGNFTYSAWVKGTDFSGTVYAIGKGINGTGYSLEFVSDGSGGGIVRPTISDGTVTVNRQYGTLQPNAWYHVAVVADRSLSTGPTVYVNGISSTCTANCGTNFTTVASISNSNQLAIGQRGADNPGNYFPGFLDDVRIYNRTLSQTEVTQLYNNGKNILLTPSYDTNGLIGWWTFDGKSIVNGTLLDSSGNGNTGFPISLGTSTFYTGGKIGQGVTFNGSSQKISLTGVSASLPFSASFWMKGATTQTGVPAIITDASTNHEIIMTNATTIQFYWNGAHGCDTNNVTQNIWHYITITVDSGGNYQCYLDSVATISGSVSGNATFTLIGSEPSANFYKGSLDDVRIYNRTLSQTEVTQLYNSGINIINK